MKSCIGIAVELEVGDVVTDVELDRFTVGVVLVLACTLLLKSVRGTFAVYPVAPAEQLAPPDAWPSAPA